MVTPAAAIMTATTTSANPSSLDLSTLPTYSGALQEDFTLWIGHLCAWFRAHNLPEEEEQNHNSNTITNTTRHNILLLALERDSVAQRYLLAQPYHVRTSWNASLGVLQEYFASPARLEMRRQAAINALYTRAFRDDTHRGESVQDLISDFEKLALQARLSQQDCMQMFSWWFRKYTAASSMLKRALTLDAAFIEALRWECVLITKTMQASHHNNGQRSNNADVVQSHIMANNINIGASSNEPSGDDNGHSKPDSDRTQVFW